MRLCHPYIRAFLRSLVAAWLLSGVIVALWLTAAASVACIAVDEGRHDDLSGSVGLGAIAVIALAGGALLSLARATLLNRRACWLQHGLSELVVAHELWRGSDAHQRDRSLAAVATVARLAGSRTTIALCEVPWAIAMLGGLWLINGDVATVASVASLLLVAIALTGSRQSVQAGQFDIDRVAQNAGDAVIGATAPRSDVSFEQAAQIASGWEVTQRMRVAADYAARQARTRLQLLVAFVQFAAAGLFMWQALAATAAGGAQAASIVMACASALAAQSILSRWALHARDVGAARAAAQHLATLRVARSGQGIAYRPRLATPDLRMPVAAAWLAGIASIAGFVGVIAHWHVPVSLVVSDVFNVRAEADVRTLRAVATSVDERLQLQTTLHQPSPRLVSTQTVKIGVLPNAAATQSDAAGLADMISSLRRRVTALRETLAVAVGIRTLLTTDEKDQS